MSDLKTFRSLGVNIIAWGTTAGLLVTAIAIARALPEDISFTPSQTAVIWLLIAAWAFMAALITRSRVKAGPDEVDIINGWSRYKFSWDEVARIVMSDGAPWPTLITKEDKRVILFGIQGSDGRSAREAVKWLQGHVK